jgi:hypothetical protein
MLNGEKETPETALTNQIASLWLASTHQQLPRAANQSSSPRISIGIQYCCSMNLIMNKLVATFLLLSAIDVSARETPVVVIDADPGGESFVF